MDDVRETLLSAVADKLAETTIRVLPHHQTHQAGHTLPFSQTLLFLLVNGFFLLGSYSLSLRAEVAELSSTPTVSTCQRGSPKAPNTRMPVCNATECT